MRESIILLIFGGIFLLVGVIVFAQTMMKRKKCSGVTTGVVKEVTTDREVQKDSNGIHSKVVFYTIVEYTVGEQKYIQKSLTGSTANAHYVGEQIEIHYNPENPIKSYWGTSNFLGLFTGTIFGLVGLGIMIVSMFIK